MYAGYMLRKNNEEEEEEEGDDDVESREREQVRILLIGSSGSGKTVMCRSLIEAYSPELDDDEDELPVYTVNDRTKDCPYIKVGWDQVLGLRDAALVVEDVISATKKQVVVLKELLDYSNHHDAITPLIMIAHCITNNNIYSLLHCFHFIFFSASQSSRPSLKRIQSEFGYNQELKDRQMALLDSCTERFCHLRLDVQRKEMMLTKVGQKEALKISTAVRDEKERQKPDLKTNAIKYLGDLPQAKKAMLLFDHIYPRIPKGSLDSAFLTVNLKNLRGERVVLSLIDYLSALTDPEAHTDKMLWKFHDYLADKGVHLPKAYVLNRDFWV
jgi:energy-coupling factor transporter ATP-binding protein EcfA2